MFAGLFFGLSMLGLWLASRHSGSVHNLGGALASVGAFLFFLFGWPVYKASDERQRDGQRQP